MKKILLIVVAMMVTLSVNAQKGMVGRVYHNPNIMSGMMAEMTKDVEKDIVDARKKAIEKREKKVGRKLTADEIKTIDKELKKIEAKVRAVKSGMGMSMTMTFKNEKEVSMKASMKMSDEAMKMAGVSWIKRKAMKAAMAMSPTQVCPYTVKGNMVIIQDEKELDTLRISADGKSLSGIYRDEKNGPIKYTLTRTK